MTQFGWQFETQILSMSDGNQALMEWVILVGGVEQDEFNTSLAWLAGYRLANGLEFGVGPNVSFNPDQESVTTSMQVAGGATLPFGDLYIPVNLSVGIAKGGPRFTTLVGWIVGCFGYRPGRWRRRRHWYWPDATESSATGRPRRG